MIFLQQNQAVSYRNISGKILGFMKDNRVCVELDDNTILYCDRDKLILG